MVNGFGLGSQFGIWKLVIGVSFVILLVGCGSNVDVTPPPAESSTPTAPNATVTLIGSLSTGSISNTEIKALNTAATGYNVVAINNATDQTYYATTDASGTFSLSIPNNVSYEVSLVGSNSRYVGPIIMSGNTSSAEVVMGITPTANTNLGQIVLDSTRGIARPTAEPTSILNSLDTALATNGAPKGSGNFGTQEISSITTTREGADMDKDGIPNLFDADEDNDGARNGILARASAATVTSNTVEAVIMASNIWASHGHADTAAETMIMRLEVIPKSGKIDEILSVQVLDVPASIKDTAIIWGASTVNSSGYPAERTLWKDVSYNLYKANIQNGSTSRDEWIVILRPMALMNLGDTFKIRVTYTGGSYQDFFISTSYVLTDWARITSYNSIPLPSTSGTSTTPESYSTNTFSVVISKPKDESGNVLTGLRCSIRYGISTSVGGTFGVSNNSTEETITDSNPTSASLSHTLNISTPGTYYIVPIAESADGQRNGEETWFTRQ